MFCHLYAFERIVKGSYFLYFLKICSFSSKNWFDSYRFIPLIIKNRKNSGILNIYLEKIVSTWFRYATYNRNNEISSKFDQTWVFWIKNGIFLSSLSHFVIFCSKYNLINNINLKKKVSYVLNVYIYICFARLKSNYSGCSFRLSSYAIKINYDDGFSDVLIIIGNK